MTGSPPGGRPPEHPAALRLHLLGGFRAVVGGRVVEAAAWRSRRARALVALLALAPGHRLHREQLLGLLWPEAEPGAAAVSLRQVLHGARRVLEPTPAPGTPSAYLRQQDEALTLTAPGGLWVDTAAFEAAAATARRSGDPAAYRAAVGLYAGELLPEDRYEDWAADRREALRGLHHALLLELAQVYEAGGERAAAIEALSRLAAAEPAHEEAHRRLMRLYALAGQRHQAVRQYHLLTETLRRDVDAEPEAASQAVYEEIRTSRLAPAPPAALAPGAPPPGRPAAPRHNLPVPLTSFIGRQREIAEVGDVLGTTRLLTLTGAGGSGKTRLALEVARRLVGQYRDGVWLVELASLADPALVPGAVAAAFRIQEEPGRPLTTTLLAVLHDKAALLVLDNCEHLLDACATLADALLRACPALRILVTGREGLHTAGEVVWRVPPLSPPAAVRLFEERARAVQPHFALTGQTALAVAQLCRRLDGLPLAIELAAARAPLLSVEQLAARLGDRFRLLTGGSRTAASRQQTLRATVAWSYDLLSPAEQALFDRLAVFAGGWTLEAAEAVGAGAGILEEEVLDLLAQLVDKSLVVAEPETAGAPRYRLLETLREYALERLQESGEVEALRRRHAERYVALAEAVEPHLYGAAQAEQLDRLERDHDNLRAALAWLVERGQAEPALRLGVALAEFWNVRGYRTEGRERLARLLALARRPGGPRTESLVKVLLMAGRWEQNLRGDQAAARALVEEGLAVARELGDRPAIADALSMLGATALGRGDHAGARTSFQESLDHAQELGDKQGIASAHLDLGITACEQGDYAAARAQLEESLARYTALGYRQRIARSLHFLGLVAYHQGDYATARVELERGLALFREVGYRNGAADVLAGLGYLALALGDHAAAHARLGEGLRELREVGSLDDIALALEGFAALAAARRQPERALRLAGAAAALREAIGTPVAPVWQPRRERTLALARRALGEGAAAAWEAGRALPLDVAIAEALAPTGPPSDEPGVPESADGARAPETARQPLPPGARVSGATPPAARRMPGHLALVGEESAPQPAARRRLPGGLSEREAEVLRLVAQGLTNAQVAARLFISPATVNSHLTAVYAKLGVPSRGAAIRFALDHGLR